MGSETQVHMLIDGQDVIGVFRERVSLQPGHPIHVRPDMSKAVLFDAATGQRI